VAGRCEVNLGEHGFIYVNKDDLSIDVHGATDMFSCPAGRYKGIEYLLDLGKLNASMPQAFLDLGIDSISRSPADYPLLPIFCIVTRCNTKRTVPFVRPEFPAHLPVRTCACT
jgi:hypothetical protein